MISRHFIITKGSPSVPLHPVEYEERRSLNRAEFHSSYGATPAHFKILHKVRTLILMSSTVLNKVRTSTCLKTELKVQFSGIQWSHSASLKPLSFSFDSLSWNDVNRVIKWEWAFHYHEIMWNYLVKMWNLTRNYVILSLLLSRRDGFI